MDARTLPIVDLPSNLTVAVFGEKKQGKDTKNSEGKVGTNYFVARALTNTEPPALTNDYALFYKRTKEEPWLQVTDENGKPLILASENSHFNDKRFIIPKIEKVIPNANIMLARIPKGASTDSDPSLPPRPRPTPIPSYNWGPAPGAPFFPPPIPTPKAIRIPTKQFDDGFSPRDIMNPENKHWCADLSPPTLITMGKEEYVLFSQLKQTRDGKFPPDNIDFIIAYKRPAKIIGSAADAPKSSKPAEHKESFGSIFLFRRDKKGTSLVTDEKGEPIRFDLDIKRSIRFNPNEVIKEENGPENVIKYKEPPPAEYRGPANPENMAFQAREGGGRLTVQDVLTHSRPNATPCIQHPIKTTGLV
ncbi:MAG: hypothetical protein EBR02_03345 [Alphaproteobacteria bacterium]|nr:hypothetical protein [Alphaproteobacteria bacterium]